MSGVSKQISQNTVEGAVDGVIDYAQSPGPHTVSALVKSLTNNVVSNNLAGGVGLPRKGNAHLAIGELGDESAYMHTRTVYRVEGNGNQRFDLNGAGNVTLREGKSMVYLTFGDEARSREFHAKRVEQGYDSHILAFEIDERSARHIERRAVSQVNNHGAPIQRVDETRTSCSYGISRDEIHLVMDGLIPGSGRILE